MELKFSTTSESGGYNQTYSYDVTFGGDLTKVYTVRDLFQHILEERTGEWGKIQINRRSTWNSYKSILCEYVHGKVVKLNQSLFDEYADQPVRSIKASGGYSVMDYFVLCLST